MEKESSCALLGTMTGVKVYLCHAFVSFKILLGPDEHYFLTEKASQVPGGLQLH